MAIKYNGTGWGLYALNGVIVPREVVEAPAEKLDAHILLKEKNAEVRREIVRKIGIERVLKDLKATILDKQGTYELVSLDIGDNRKRPYLKMLNPSSCIPVWHIEGVPPDICSVNEAIVWRNNSKELPAVVT